ncbi:MAG: SurA N-terminal domain-containing protein [Pseudomonadota bacterium]
MKNKISIFVMLWVVAAICVCSGVHAAEIVDKIVAIVNNDIVTLVDIQKGAAPYMKNIEASGYSREKQDELIRNVNQDILNSMIERILTQQEAERYGILIPDEEIDSAIENIKSRRSLSQKEFEDALIYEGLNIADFRENIKKQLLQSKIINVAVKSKVVITESGIKQYYSDNKEKYAGKQKHYLRNILMQDKEKISQIKHKLDDGQSFIELAKQFSMASNAAEGGDLGLFDIYNFSKEIKESLSSLKAGQYTDVVTTTQGFQIFYVQDIVLDGEQPYEVVSKEIEETLYQQQVEKKFKVWLETLKQNAHIKIML